MPDAPQVKQRLPHTWRLFFARHGGFTPVQLQAIPPIAAGQDALVVAATASGKTEAVLAPLLERLWPRLPRPGLHLLYICPTRALVRDLHTRLAPPLADASIRLGMKTGDAPLPAETPAILLTTPESTDSLLTRAPRLFADLQAVVLDEIHLFDNTPRGDHLRCLLPRIERIRTYGRPGAPPAQRVALSATVPDPAGVAARYLQDAAIVLAPGDRGVVADVQPFTGLADLAAALGRRPGFKALIFCNSRVEVEETAAALRQHLPHHGDIFVHYSNLETAVRREVEERFAAASVAVCVATSTLELGIDIGSVDDVVLLGAPPDLDAFLQRAGRGGRRTGAARVLCLPKTPGEWARFDAFLTLAPTPPHPLTSPPPHPPTPTSPYTFRPAILVQQTFSLLRQSPTGAVRLADLRRIAPPEVSSDTIRRIVSELAFAGYLQARGLGEWRPDEKLQLLFDQHDVYSNIGGAVLKFRAVDAHSGRVLAYTERPYPPRTVLRLGGQPREVVWAEGNRYGLAATDKPVDEVVSLDRTFPAVPFGVARIVAAALGLAPTELAVLPLDAGLLLFHFWGTLWGELLTAVLAAHALPATFINEYCLHVGRPLTQLPPWDETAAHQAARRRIHTLGKYLELGRFHSLLPADVATSATLALLDLPRFADTYRAARLVDQPRLYQPLTLLRT
ncbi:MAG: DEAD/DEAH box helicase [Anaerolineales bacterium]|nr:DEAD/DEAH box helicase [Anaerolineales bacterium]